MKKISKKQMEQMDNMIKNIWTPPTNNKKESRKLTKYKNKKYETQTVLIRLTNSNKIPSSVMDYAVNDKDIIIDKEQNLALVEVRLTHQQYPAIPKHVKKYMVEQVELKDKEAIKKLKKKADELDKKNQDICDQQNKLDEKFALVDRSLIFAQLFEAFNTFYAAYVAAVGSDQGFIDTFQHFVEARRHLHKNTGGEI